jgi:SulP family sulfate permease
LRNQYLDAKNYRDHPKCCSIIYSLVLDLLNCYLKRVMMSFSRINSTYIASEGSAGVINGLILCIYSFTFGSLLVSHHGGSFLGVAIGSMLIGGIFGSLYGLISKDKSLTCGPSGGAASIMAGPALIFFSGENVSAGTIMFQITFLGLIVALIFYGIARFSLSNIFKYVPYSVFVGLMAATGYLIAKGGLAIIYGDSFNGASLLDLALDFKSPEILLGILIAAIFTFLAPKVSAQILIPGVIIVFSVLINLYLRSDLCALNGCQLDQWFFVINTSINWVPSWGVSTQGFTWVKFLEFLPTILSVAFICVLSILVSFENLYIWYSEEFDEPVEFRNHSLMIALSAIFGGFISTLAFQRVILNKKIGATILGSLITSIIAIVAFWHIDEMVRFIPSCVIGGFLLYQGIEILQKSFSNRSNLTRIDLALSVLILFLVAIHSFVYGFIVGLLLSFMYSLYSLSRIPLITSQGDLRGLMDPQVFSHDEGGSLCEKCKRIQYFHLEGYLFYGSVIQLDKALTSLNYENIDGVLLDASKITGFDTSAKICLERILSRHHKKIFKWIIVADKSFLKAFQLAFPSVSDGLASIQLFSELNLAVDSIKKSILNVSFARSDSSL